MGLESLKKLFINEEDSTEATPVVQKVASNKFPKLDEIEHSSSLFGNIEKVKSSFLRILSYNELNTIIFSTHDIRLAVELADSIYIIGHPEGITDYSTIIKNYDLKELGLAWKEYGPEHESLTKQIKEVLLIT